MLETDGQEWSRSTEAEVSFIHNRSQLPKTLDSAFPILHSYCMSFSNSQINDPSLQVCAINFYSKFSVKYLEPGT